MRLKLNVLDVKLWSFTLIPFLMCGLIYKFVYSSLSQRLKAVKKDLKVTNIEYASSQDKAAERTRLRKQKERLEEKMDSYEANLLGEGEVSEFLNRVTMLATESAIYLDNMKPYPLSDAGFCKQLALDMNIRAGYPKLMEYLFKLEQLPGLIKIVRLTISSPAQGSEARVNMRAGFLISKSKTGQEKSGLEEVKISGLKIPSGRDIFSRTAKAFTGEGSLDLKLQATVPGPENGSAVINGEVFSKGDRVGEWTIQSIREGEVLLRSDEGQEKLLRLGR